jgi:hypothetical protein
MEVRPLDDYFSFGQKSRHRWQRLLVMPVRLYFRLLSVRPMAWIRATALNPFLIVLVQK